jgi:hypothetical protein
VCVCVCVYVCVRVSIHICIYNILLYGGCDSSVGMATYYELGDPKFETLCMRGIPYPSRPARRPTQLPVQVVKCIFYGGKAAGAWR